MLGKKTGIYWRICWGFITPVLMIAILMYSLVTMEPLEYNNQPFPTGAYGNITNGFTFFIRMLYIHVV
jgi:solute carrier family 6 amino acid transporter-like protein 5/7/9/14